MLKPTIETITETNPMLKALMLLLSVFALTFSLSAQEQEQERATPELSPELRAEIEAIEATTRDIRGLQEQGDFTLMFPTRQEVSAFFAEEIERAFEPETLEREMHFYVAFDLIEEGTDLRALFTDLYSQQVAGFYDPETDEMNVILTSGELPESDLPLMESIIYSHEYVHALQDQHFDLQRFLDEELTETQQFDRQLAQLALVEGDATQVMNSYTALASQANPLGALAELLISGAQAGNLFLPPGIPDVIEQELLWPYEGGASFVAALYQEDGWNTVNEAFANPPVSTEQIYHPEKYLSGERPLEVDLVGVQALLGAGWTQVLDRKMGEFYLRQYLDTQLSRAQVDRAATGWGGDRFQVYVNDEGDEVQRAWVMEIAWDEAAEGQEFAELYAEFGAERFGNAADDRGCWTNANADQALCLVTYEGGNISRLSFAPTLDLAWAMGSRD